MASQRRAGIVALKIDGVLFDVKGAVKYGIGKETREAIVGHDRVHGYKAMPTVPFVECEFTDSDELNLDNLAAVTDSTVEVQLANGKSIALRNAWCTNPDGLGASTDEGNISVRFEGKSCEEISA